ncbi:neurotrypsin-like [Mytilus trossulus]|uniref:neurotrypsin-like n=1 Tax=Mytilus trossulus TaxID=6551 RepID=UPI0030048798
MEIAASRVQDGQGTIWFTDVACSGSESQLVNCTYNVHTAQCEHYKDVGIHCFFNCSTEDEGTLRLGSKQAENKGRLEIHYKGEWGTVCENYFGDIDAAVACRQLGYCSGMVIAASRVQDGQGTIWFTDVACSGSESQLVNCTYNVHTAQCEHYKDVGIHCFFNCSTEDEGTLRLGSKQAENKGRLEIHYKGEWGTVCENYFGDIDAAVACRQLGYCSGMVIAASRVQDGQGTIWLTDVACSGSESQLVNCTYNVHTAQCEHYKDVGIHCFLNCSSEDEGALRIMGFIENEGRLEINYKGEWGTVCDNYFDDGDAAVACRQLGYCSGMMIAASRVQDGQDTIWLSDVVCSGSESKLVNCIYNVHTTRCEHYEDVGIHCFLSCPTEYKAYVY